MRSASARAMRPLAALTSLCLLGAGAAGCSTTQEKAAAQQAKAEHILRARAERQHAKKRERGKQDHGKQKGKAK